MKKNLAIFISALTLMSVTAVAQTSGGAGNGQPDVPTSTSPPSKGTSSNASNPATNAGDLGNSSQNDSTTPKKKTKHRSTTSSNNNGAPSSSTNSPNGPTGSNRNNGVNGS